MIHQLTDKRSKFILLIIFFLFLNSINFKEKNFIFGNISEINVVGLDNQLNNAIKDNLKYYYFTILVLILILRIFYKINYKKIN